MATPARAEEEVGERRLSLGTPVIVDATKGLASREGADDAMPSADWMPTVGEASAVNAAVITAAGPSTEAGRIDFAAAPDDKDEEEEVTVDLADGRGGLTGLGSEIALVTLLVASRGAYKHDSCSVRNAR